MQPPLGFVVPVLLGLLVGCAAPAGEPLRPAGAGASAVATSPLDVLRDWDEARAEAWAARDADALRALYVPGSMTGIRDVRSLLAYAGRGLRVSGIRLQRLSARVLAHQDTLLRLEVVERLLGANVDDGSVVRRLPAGQPSRRILELRYLDGAWVVGRVRFAAR